MTTFDSLGAVLGWLRDAPEGTTLSASTLAGILENVADAEPVEAQPELVRDSGPAPWRERLWTCPSETRMGVGELADALDRAKSWIYARTQQSADDRIPHRKLDGTLVFRAGEIRTWIRAREEEVVGVPTAPPENGRNLRAV